jgi:hypothetical protein
MPSKNKKRKQNRHQETNALRQESRRAEKEANKASWVKIVCQDLPDEMRENVQDLLTKTGKWIRKNKLMKNSKNKTVGSRRMVDREGFISQYCHTNVSAVLAYVKSEMKNPFPHQINLVTGYVAEDRKYQIEIGDEDIAYGFIYHSWLEIDGHRVDPTPDTLTGKVRDFPRHYPEPKDEVINLPLDEVSNHQDLSAGWSEIRADELACEWRDKTIQEWEEIRLYPNHPNRKELLDRFWDESLHLRHKYGMEPSVVAQLIVDFMCSTMTFLPSSDRSEVESLVGERVVYPKSSESLLPEVFREYIKDPSELSGQDYEGFLTSGLYWMLKNHGVLPVVASYTRGNLSYGGMAPVIPLCLKTFKPLFESDNMTIINVFPEKTGRLAA